MGIEEQVPRSAGAGHQSPEEEPAHKASEEHIPADDARAIARRRQEAEEKLEEHRRAAEEEGHSTGGPH